MKKLFTVLALVGALAFAVTACSTPDPTSGKIGTAKDGNEVKIEQAAMNLVKAVEEGKYKLVSTEELKKWIDANEKMIIIDTMPEDSYKQNRIPTAVNALLEPKMDKVTPEQKEAFLKALGPDKNAKIVVYCGFVGCPRSDVGAKIAMEAGYTNVYRMPGGIVSWVDAGYDVEKDK